MKQTIAVVGGGVFGLTAAIELRLRGWHVRVFDPGTPPNPAASSTDISKAVRMDYGGDAFYTDLAERAIRRWRRWNRDLGETLYHEVGFLLLTRRPMGPGTFEADSFALLRSKGHQPQRIGPADLRRRFPAWSSDEYVDGYFNPQAGWTPSARVVARLAASAREAGVRFQQAKVVHLRESGTDVTGVVTADGSAYSADRVLVAAGAWTACLVPELAASMWTTGQPVLHFAPRDPTPFAAERFPVWGADIATTGWYGFPVTDDGVVKVANHGPGLRVSPDEPLAVADTDVERCRELFGRSLPALADAVLVGSRLCLYCDTADGDFWIGRHPRQEGLVVAAGGSGHAFKFAPVIGEIIADVVERRANPWAGRFDWRTPRRGRAEQARHRKP